MPDKLPIIDTPEPETSPPQTQRKQVRLGSASAFAFSAQVLALVTSFVASVLIARTLGPVGKGQLSVVQQVLNILSVVLNMGITTANTYFIGKNRHGVGEVLGNSFLASIVLGLIGAPLLWLFTMGPAAVVEGIPLAAMAITIALLPIALGNQFVQGINVGVGEMKAISRTQMVGTAASIVVILIAWKLDRLTVPIAMLATAVNVAITFLLNTIRLFKRYTQHIRIHLATMREATTYSFKAYFNHLATYLNYRADIIIVGYLAGAETVGIYSIAVMAAELMWYVPKALAQALLSKSVQAGEQSADMLAMRSSRVTAALMLLICAVAAALINPLIRLFYGAEFLPAVLPFLVLLPGVWLNGISQVLFANLTSKGLLYPWIAMTTAAANVAINIALVPRMGAMGAGLASSISYGAGAIAIMTMFARATDARPRDWLLINARDIQAVSSAARGYIKQGLKRST
ncbi:MAG: oligosaccharide flippase family protein [Coriobacteriia bacterium]|nr:oligosaccharide flippase family protein [Coriobacteriia bacterium]